MLSNKYLVFIALLPYVMCENYCPDEYRPQLSPCTFSKDNIDKECQIDCYGLADIDLGEIFTNLSAILLPNAKHFYAINITNTAITELKENTFKDITFKSIVIESNGALKLIHEKAFADSNETQVLSLRANPLLESTEENSIFNMSRRFPQLTQFSSRNNDAITEIPAQAFAGLYSLSKVELLGTGIATLGEDLFPRLFRMSSIWLSNTSISNIPDGEFHCLGSQKLTLGMSSTHITGASFANRSLAQLLCPTELYLNVEFFMNDFTYMDETVFLAFYAANERNAVYTGPVLDCDDCRNYWLVQRQELRTRIAGTGCRNGTITDSRNFANCK